MKKRGIVFKIFCITSTLLTVSALIIYLTFYFLLPKYYLNYKKSDLQSGMNKLVKTLKQTQSDDSHTILSDFAYKYNVRISIDNGEDVIFYFPQDVNKNINKEIRDRFRITQNRTGNPNPYYDNLRKHDTISITDTATFLDDSKEYKITIISTVQPIDEASKVILMFLPYMLVVIIILSILAAYIYSHIISKPLIHLNGVAKQMAGLDFSIESHIDTKDELGELSRSLDTLAKNLKINIEELNEANLQLKDDIQKEREQETKRREFIATISHELKTPITAVTGQLEGMIYEIGAYKDREKYLWQSYKIMKDMEKLVYEILDISKLESTLFTPQFATIDLSTLVLDILEKFYYFTEVKNIEFITDIEKGVFIVSDEKLITKAIANIISNAVKYSSENEKVFIDLKTINEKVQLQILNTGAHIDEDQLEKIFLPFYRVEKSRNRKTGGSGLGLYIVKRVLDMLRTDYSINNVSEGVKFIINFEKA